MTTDEASERIRQLETKREELDRLISFNVEELNRMGVGLEKSLVDSEGFPLAGIDLYHARSLRGETRGLINDYKETMNQIETLLPTALSVGRPLNSTISLKPFARIAGIQAGSVAYKSGLLVGDQIVKLNHISGLDSMDKVAKAIDECKRQGRPLQFSLIRGDSTGIVEITISDLHGPLGCHLVPITTHR